MKQPKEKRFSPQKFVQKYRENSNWDSKIKSLGNLKEKNRQLVISLLSNQEIEEYQKRSSVLIERRYNCIRQNKPCLDALTAKNPNLKEIYNKYYHCDLSIPVYTIKAIINAYEGICTHITKDDGKYSKNANNYYRECKRYWEIIETRWDTDTGRYSKEQIENREFSEYHINANKVKTILKQLKKWKKEQYNYKKYIYECKKEERRLLKMATPVYEWDKVAENKKWYHINREGIKSRVSSANELQNFLDRDYEVLKGCCKFYSHTTLDGITFKKLTKANYEYILDRDNMLIKKGYIK